ncbi:hypothetical protein Pla175_01860 [Pirellulimonas nuda]|uniref:Flagellar protein FliL n=1 Tax=Pirellulimonas nuda TaxID=2528009 RepID=A0A518D5T9_9BACT|nr:hypothetical protein [Pirellulimonas nuda]QDU86833.1 hypothetical protein Pla175_01860 [Pirellulimonas nuda]
MPILTKLLPPAMMAALALGCYDPDALVERARNHSVRTRLEEVELGRFYVARPRDSRSGEIIEAQLHLFGTLPHYRLKKVGRELAAQEHVVRHNVILALREAPDEELADPNLSGLTQRLLGVINQCLREAPIESLGYYEARFTRS